MSWFLLPLSLLAALGEGLHWVAKKLAAPIFTAWDAIQDEALKLLDHSS
jgi:hypothetical protein